MSVVTTLSMNALSFASSLRCAAADASAAAAASSPRRRACSAAASAAAFASHARTAAAVAACTSPSACASVRCAAASAGGSPSAGGAPPADSVAAAAFAAASAAGGSSTTFFGFRFGRGDARSDQVCTPQSTPADGSGGTKRARRSRSTPVRSERSSQRMTFATPPARAVEIASIASARELFASAALTVSWLSSAVCSCSAANA